MENRAENVEKVVETVKCDVKIKRMIGADQHGRVLVALTDGNVQRMAVKEDGVELVNEDGETLGLLPVYDGPVLQGFRKVD